MKGGEGTAAARRFAWSGPLTVLPLPETEAASLRARRIVWLLMGLGIAARCMRLALRFPLWSDEALLATNLMDREYAELLEPLGASQVAPFLFMWVQLTFVKLMGFNEFALRMFPFLCGIGSLFLFRRLAARLLGGGACVGAVALFAVAYPLIRYSGDAKPYGSDVLVTLILLTLAVEAWRQPAQWRPMAALIAFLPLGIGLSYPAVFVGGGVSLALGASALARGGRRAWLRWGLYNFVLIASFAGLFALSAAGQAEAEGDFMRTYWPHAFPPYKAPLELAAWLVKTHAGSMLGYPVGSNDGGSSLTLLCCIAGTYVLLRERRWTLALLFFVPPGLHLVAAAMQRFPYAGHMRFTLYLAPILCLLAPLGAAWATARFVRPARRMRLCAILLGLFALIPLGSMVRDAVRPYKRAASFARGRDFARWFWHDKALDGELVGLRSDLGLYFSARGLESVHLAMYVCNQHIYSKRHARGEPPDFARVSKQWPLRVVQVRAHSFKYDRKGFERWMTEMQTKYELVDHEIYPMVHMNKGVEPLFSWIDVYEFVPKQESQGKR